MPRKTSSTMKNDTTVFRQPGIGFIFSFALTYNWSVSSSSLDDIFMNGTWLNWYSQYDGWHVLFKQKYLRKKGWK